MDIAKSTNNVPIRLPEERWIHIVENHDDLAGHYDEVLNSVEEPDYIVQGYGEALVALTEVEEEKFLAVIYLPTTFYDSPPLSCGWTMIDKQTCSILVSRGLRKQPRLRCGKTAFSCATGMMNW